MFINKKKQSYIINSYEMALIIIATNLYFGKTAVKDRKYFDENDDKTCGH